jgi:hypothetical protein
LLEQESDKPLVETGRRWFPGQEELRSHERLIFVDEAGVNTAMTRRLARVPRGERAHDSAPRNYSEPTSLINALGLRRGLLATMTITGAVDTLCFDAYVAQGCVSANAFPDIIRPIAHPSLIGNHTRETKFQPLHVASL